VQEQEVELYYLEREEGRYGWGTRLSMMWRVDEWGHPSPELDNVRATTTIGLIGGGFFGAYKESVKVYRIFLEQNRHTMFAHPREAQRALQDRVLLGMMQGGWRAGSRMGILSFTFSAVAQSLTAVRNYVNPLDYALAGGVMGACYRLGMGPKGMLGAGLAGAVLGLQGGALAWALQGLSGQTVAQRYLMDYQAIRDKNRIKLEAAKQRDKRRELLEDSQTTKDQASVKDRFFVNTRLWLEDKGVLQPSSDITPAPDKTSEALLSKQVSVTTPQSLSTGPEKG